MRQLTMIKNKNKTSITQKGGKMVNLTDTEITKMECNPDTGAVAIPENWEVIPMVAKVREVLDGQFINHLNMGV